MAALGNLARDTAKRVEESGQAIWGTVKNFSLKNPNGTTYVSKPPGVIEKGFTGFLKGFVGRPLGWGLKVIDVTAAFFLTPVKWVASAPGAFFKAFPRFAPIATVAGGVMGIGSWLAHRRSAAMVGQYAQAQDMAMQAAAAQEAANTQAPVSYKNSASHAEVDAKIAADRAQGLKPASQTEALAARQTAAAAQPVTTVA